MLLKFIFTLFFVMAACDYHLTCVEGEHVPFLIPNRPNSISIPREKSGQPVKVNISAHIENFCVDSAKERFGLNFEITMGWQDSRLAFDSKDPLGYREINDPTSIWTPDLFVVNEVPFSHEPIATDQTYIEVYPDGKILASQRVGVMATCPMNLRIYPFDKQTCAIQMESYGYTVDDMIVDWNLTAPSPVTGELICHDFEINLKWQSSQTKFRGKMYSSPRLELNLIRTPTMIVFRVILPISTVTIFSWASFFFSKKEMLIRLTLCIVPIIAYLIQCNFGSRFFIEPGYLTGLDIWAGISLFVMLAALFECIYIIYKTGTNGRRAEEEALKIDYKARVIFAIFIILFDVFCAIYVFMARGF